jgi:hypothetical protein
MSISPARHREHSEPIQAGAGCRFAALLAMANLRLANQSILEASLRGLTAWLLQFRRAEPGPLGSGSRGAMALRLREPRRKVLIKARMRVGASWSDACILDLSSRGMLVQSRSIPQRGNYLEIRRGRHVVVARVVWSLDQRFGVQTQEPVCADDLLRETDNSSIGAQPFSATVERRSTNRPTAAHHEASRRRGRTYEFGSLILFGVAAAFILLATIDKLLGRPLDALETALAQQTSAP